MVVALRSLEDSEQCAKETVMRKLVGLSLCVSLGLLAGCATSSSEDSTARLPTGVKLLDSDRDTCDGVVHVNSRSVASSREVVVRPGQNAAFELGRQSRGTDGDLHHYRAAKLCRRLSQDL